MRVKGKAIGVRVFEVMAEKGLLSPERERLRALFSVALEDYRAQRFDQAGRGFSTCLTIDSNDGPSQTFAERCAAYCEKPPPDGWDGVWRL